MQDGDYNVKFGLFYFNKCKESIYYFTFIVLEPNLLFHIEQHLLSVFNALQRLT